MLPIDRRLLLSGLVAACFAACGVARASDYPSRPIELIVPVSAGGGTDIVGRAFADAAKKYLPQQPITVFNKPGASGAIGMGELINAKPDGYKIGIVIVELTILPNLGTVKFTASDLRPIARLNADPSAITVRADAPWKTIEEFLAHARANPKKVTMGNGGNGSIWHLAAAALEDKTGISVNHVPFQGSAPAVVGLLGGHVDAVSVSPGEVAQHVAAGKLRTLAVMADRRWAGVFEAVPTLKERGIDLSVEAWRGLAVPKAAPPDVVDTLSTLARKAADDDLFKTTLSKANLGWSYADAAGFQVTIDRDRAFFKQLVPKLEMKN